ncbi:MAG: hypothetical protein ACLFRK_00745 [Candidatus Nanohaloarchaea archaeon]
MFNIGGDDKEKLKENMEEIREMVNSKKQVEETEEPEPSMPPEQKEENTVPQETPETGGLQKERPHQEQEQEDERPTGLSSGRDTKQHLKSISSEIKDIDREEEETLFIEVDEFQNVQEMVEEMKYLSREMKDLMESLEDGVEEDRRVEGEAEEVLNEFSKRRENVQSSLQ